MTHRIDTVESRAKLKARPTPYWQKLRAGLALGFRKPAAGSVGAWVAQVYAGGGPGKQTRKSLGDFADLPPGQRFDAARRAAEALAEHLAGGGQASTMTVAEVCATYVEHLRAEGRGATADDAMARFRRRVLGSKLAKIDVRKLTAHHLRVWRQGLRAWPVVANPHAEADQQRTRERAPSTTNRDTTALRAALNFAVTGGLATSDAPWRIELRPIKGATRRRDLYDPGQRRALVAYASDDVRPFLQALCLLPLRPGALAALTVGDFDRRLGALRIPADKAGAGRVITLPEQTAEFLAESARDKLPGAPLFARADGSPWGRHEWKKRVAAAATAAGLPAGASAYTLRHSAITDLIAGGCDTLTAARLAGTSLPMIERHYGHLRASHGAAALARLAGVA